MLEQAGPTSLVDSFVSALESVQNPKAKIESIIDDPVDALKDFGSLIRAPNTASNTPYLERCKEAGVEPHPARFPKQIPEHFLEFLTPVHERYPWDRGRFDRPVVLDIFAGSNLTGAVAEERGRYWLAFEKDQDYVENSKLRFPDE
jgi:site-specific DNA-methyltransferase (cytosine-N4-specific)